uniref:Uncharacterized protein n=1 Tax=Anguilla anguilla TaxID=7936 RepID=A0A0E9QMN1_ANGAN
MLTRKSALGELVGCLILLRGL